MTGPEGIIAEYKSRHPRPYRKRGDGGSAPVVAPRAGFEPARGPPHRLSRPAP